MLKHFEKVIILFLLITGLASGGAAQGYQIKIRIKGLKDTTCYLAYHYGDKQYLKDTAKVDSKGNFIFKGKDPLPGGIYMTVLPDKRYFEFIVSEQNFFLETDTVDYVRNMKVKDSEENRLFYEYLKFLAPKGKDLDALQKELADSKSKEDSLAVKEKMEKLNKEVVEYKKNLASSYPNLFVGKLIRAMEPIEVPKEEAEKAKAEGDSTYGYRYYKSHYWDNIDFSDDRILRTPVYHQKLKEFFSKVVFPQVDSITKDADWLVSQAKDNKEFFKYTVWYITTSHETSNLMGADAVFVHMVEKYYMTKQAYWVDSTALAKISERAMTLKPLLIGKKIPNVMLEDTLGARYMLHNMKGKFIVVYFWDPKCGHCQKETPKLYELYNKYKSQGVEVFAVNIDRELKDWKKFMNQHKLYWTNVYDPHYSVSFRQKFDVYATPVMYVINDKKEIVAKRLGVEQLDEVLGNMLKRSAEQKQ